MSKATAMPPAEIAARCMAGEAHSGQGTLKDHAGTDSVRRALQHRVTCSTTIAGAKALLHSLDFRDGGPVWALQELHKELDPT